MHVAERSPKQKDALPPFNKPPPPTRPATAAARNLKMAPHLTSPRRPLAPPPAAAPQGILGAPGRTAARGRGGVARGTGSRCLPAPVGACAVGPGTAHTRWRRLRAVTAPRRRYVPPPGGRGGGAVAGWAGGLGGLPLAVPTLYCQVLCYDTNERRTSLSRVQRGLQPGDSRQR